MKRIHFAVECLECHEMFSDKSNIDSILSFDNDGMCKSCAEIYYQAKVWKKEHQELDLISEFPLDRAGKPLTSE